MKNPTRDIPSDRKVFYQQLTGLYDVNCLNQSEGSHIKTLYVGSIKECLQRCEKLGGKILHTSSDLAHPKTVIVQDPYGFAVILSEARQNFIDLNKQPAKTEDCIELIGVRTNNLKNINVKIPLNFITVITGVSGSGKTSLAYDTIFAEGQRRFQEALLPHSRGWASSPTRSVVDSIYGLPPVIPIKQKATANNPRSTLGTITELSGYLRLLFASIGKPHCPITHEELVPWNSNQLLDHFSTLPPQTKVKISTPSFTKTNHDIERFFAEAKSADCKELLIDDTLWNIGDQPQNIDRTSSCEAILGDFVLGEDPEKHLFTMIHHGLTTVGDRFIRFQITNDCSTKASFFKSLGASSMGVIAGNLEPTMFSFNTSAGACDFCSGLGVYQKPDPDLIVRFPGKSLREGPFDRGAFPGIKSWEGRILQDLSQIHNFDIDTPYLDLHSFAKEIIMYGTSTTQKKNKEHFEKWSTFEGIVPRISRRYNQHRKKESQKPNPWMQYMADVPCPACVGQRLKNRHQLTTIQNMDIHALGNISLYELLDFLKKLPLDRRKSVQPVIEKLVTRLNTLLDLDLGYLTVNRAASTLSGGEIQRLQIATQIGSGLQNMLYVVDEPSIGMHSKDKEKLIKTLRDLQYSGNTILIVEHDEQIIRAADYIIEMGPEAGKFGGQIVTTGPLETIMACPDSPTGRFLCGSNSIALPESRKKPLGISLKIKGARANNLKNIDLEVPLGVFTCITGTSGSGKSTLIHDIIGKQLTNHTGMMIHDLDSLTGGEHLDGYVSIDQSPIGQSSRSNPATFLGFFDNIKSIFASMDKASKMKLGRSHFSFNTRQGRCRTCSGRGSLKTDLIFMPSVEIPCHTCYGNRFNDEILQITYKDKNIAQVLDMTVQEGITFFGKSETVLNKLTTLYDLGLGYLKIGHPASQLSGGEAQRVKIARELSKLKFKKNILYVLDEPTAGLHFVDIQHLIDAIYCLVSAGNTVVVIEHHLDVVKVADHVIDLGPEGGAEGGEVVAEGPPEAIIAEPRSHTGRYLKTYLQQPIEATRITT